MSDASFNVPAELTYEQTLGYQGELFSFAQDFQLAAGVSYKIGITSAQNFVILHSRWRTAADRCRVNIYEAVPYTGGTLKSIINRNRASSKTLAAITYIGVTATVDTPVFSGLFGLKAAGELEVEEPVVFKKNVPYIIELINDATSQSDAVSYVITCCEINQA